MIKQQQHVDIAEALYFLAIIPPEPIYNEALKWKQFFAEHYQSKAALNSPPHITLHMPFKWKIKKEQKLFTAFTLFANERNAFEVQIKSFGAFPPRVIFMDMMKSEALLKMQRSLNAHMKKALQLFNANYKAKAFNPHITLAFRDLKKGLFETAYNEVKDKKFEATFLVKEIALLKHNGKSWDLYKNFELSSKVYEGFKPS